MDTATTILDADASTAIPVLEVPAEPVTSPTPTPTSTPAADSGEVIATPAPPTPSAPAVDASAQIAALQARLDELTARMSNAPVVAQVDQNQIVSAIVAAEHARRAEFDRQQAQRVDLQPPTFTEDQKTALVSDPDALLAAMQAWAKHGAKVALAQVAPHLSDVGRKANIAFELAGPNSDAVADWAFNRGRDMAVANGMNAADYDRISQHVYDSLWQAAGQNELQFAKMTLNPQVISTAAHMVAAQRPNGVAAASAPTAPPIVDKKAPAPTVGAGTHRSDATPSTPRPGNINLAYAESKLGIKLSPDDIKRLNALTKENMALGRTVTT